MTMELQDFVIYRPHRSVNYNMKTKKKEEKVLANEMVSLHDINRKGEKIWYFDGILRSGEAEAYVQKVPFEILSIGGYEDKDLDTVGSCVWIQSIQGKRQDIWYTLKTPASEYKRYHEPFIWMADFAKHVIDYLSDHDNVSLIEFKSRFFAWLQDIHRPDSKLQSWQKEYGDTDFRRAVAAHSVFLSYQALQVDVKYGSHPLWGEIDWVSLNAVSIQTEDPKKIKDQKYSKRPSVSLSKTAIRKTTVTPFVFDCFKHLPWVKFLDLQEPRLLPSASKQGEVALEPSSRYKKVVGIKNDGDSLRENVAARKDISKGDVIAITPDKVTKWKTKDNLWYGYVQGTTELKKGQALSIIWLYRPSDTACQLMRYPFENELFLSDHCNCGDDYIYAHEIIHQPQISFFGSPDNLETGYFVRQKYIGDEQSWVTLQASDFRCKCKLPSKPLDLEIGDTLLVVSSLKRRQALEPVELIEIHFKGHEDTVRVRRLLRRGRDFGHQDAEPNELVYTAVIEDIEAKDIIRPCHIRFYTTQDKEHNKIPTQYRRRGTADFYYIMYQDSHESALGLIPLAKPWPCSMKQGWNPINSPSQSVMRGLDIFCGGGNLGRGLEEGGAVRFEWAVDYFKEAIHTYRANLRAPTNIHLFCGSVNDYLSQAMNGSKSTLVAPVGSVEFISAGSPCQGFSTANQWKGNDQALLNVSMVASVVSFVDFYRPKYALLENVTGMAKCKAKDGDKNVFAQVLCALVGMGYQVRSFTLDAWSFGAPQSRTRLFISIAASGLTPLPDPPQSHSSPELTRGLRSLGRTANGLTIGRRHENIVPFEYVTIGEATKDLPLNYDARTDCIRFPDHRPSRKESALNHIRISCVPRYPPGMNFITAKERGWMPRPQIEVSDPNPFQQNHPDKSRSWKRVLPNALIATVTTACTPQDNLCGAWVHWEACRCMTVMEVRRAQGFPDEEVIVGSPAKQWKIVGNSVARPVALALGMALRKAWLLNRERPRPNSLSNSLSLIVPGSITTKFPMTGHLGNLHPKTWKEPPVRIFSTISTFMAIPAPKRALSPISHGPSERLHPSSFISPIPFALQSTSNSPSTSTTPDPDSGRVTSQTILSGPRETPVINPQGVRRGTVKKSRCEGRLGDRGEGSWKSGKEG